VAEQQASLDELQRRLEDERAALGLRREELTRQIAVAEEREAEAEARAALLGGPAEEARAAQEELVALRTELVEARAGADGSAAAERRLQAQLAELEGERARCGWATWPARQRELPWRRCCLRLSAVGEPHRVCVCVCVCAARLAALSASLEAQAAELALRAADVRDQEAVVRGREAELEAGEVGGVQRAAALEAAQERLSGKEAALQQQRAALEEREEQ
jgi:hypothetical protein